METDNNRHNDITKEIGECKEKFSKKDYKKLKLGLLLRAAKGVDGFSADCSECKDFQGEITKLVEGLSDLAEPSEERCKTHLGVIKTIIKHLQKDHKLIGELEYTALGISMGLVFGVAISAAFGNVAIGIPIGMCVGLAVGSYMDAKAKKDGKVI